jgi:hypothetical protein
MFTPAFNLLNNQVTRPTLEKGKFMEFKLKFPVFLEKATAGQGILADDMKLSLLKDCIPQAARLELQKREEEFQRGQAPAPRYADFWAWICRTYGTGHDDQTTIKEEIQRLEPRCNGRLTLELWENYVGEFELLKHRLDEPNESELVLWVLPRVPRGIRTRLLAKQARRNAENPVLKVTGVDGLSAEQVRQVIQILHREKQLNPRCRVEVCRGGYTVHCRDPKVESAFLSMSGRELSSGHRPHFTFLKPQMSLDEVFNFVKQDLEVDERVEEVGRLPGESDPRTH